MHSLTFEDVFPIARELAQKKAKGFVGRWGLTAADLDDIEGQLLLTFYIRFSKFNARRASVRTFASRVMDKELVSILRYRLARCREHLLEPAPLEDLAELNGTAIRNKPTPLQRQQFWLDVERALAPCSSRLRETAVALCWERPLELSRSSGRSRACIYDRIRRLRKAFNNAGQCCPGKISLSADKYRSISWLTADTVGNDLK